MATSKHYVANPAPRRPNAKRAIEPGETLIGARQAKAPNPPEGKRIDPLRDHWHTILDQILDSGQADAVNAIQYVLLVTEERVHLKGRKPKIGK